MKRLGVYAFLLLFTLTVVSFSSPEKVIAAVTDQQIAELLRDAENFRAADADFANRYANMVKSVADRFKNDPDVDVHQLRRYVLEGVPGSTIPNQTGFIPMLNVIINGGGNSDRISRARLSLSQAQQMLINSKNRGLSAGEVITREEEQARTMNAARTAAAEAGKELQARTSDTKKCTNIMNASIVDCLDAGFTFLIKNLFLQVAGFLVWLTANMLNFAIQVSILDFAKWAPNSLYPLWIILRQIVSLVVVFAGLWLGFMYIIGREDTFGKYIGWLVIFALFVNFSYPISRSLVDVSNIVALNIYTSAVGSGPLSTDASAAIPLNGETSAGSLIMQKLGLQGLVASATDRNSTKGFINDIQSTPSALIALVFVLYAAYVFLMATGIIAARTGVLIFLIVASPLLLVDAVVPKLGEVAVKMRKMFFEQLIVAPVFMIMLALTLKFMDIFQSTGPNGESGPLGAMNATSGTLQMAGNNTNTIQAFFGILMMLIMLHIMLKVTKHVAGAAGQFATNVMGKVGGFGLATATAGSGFLARSTIGAAASRLRDSEWMKNAKGGRVGGGIYALTNSLSQSTFDARNVGMVSRGLGAAGLTGGMGVSMQKGNANTYDKSFINKRDRIKKEYESMESDKARQDYYDRTKNGPISRIAGRLGIETSGVKIAKTLDVKEMDLKKKQEGVINSFISADSDKRKEMLLSAKAENNQFLVKKLETAQNYFDHLALKPDNLKNGEKDLAVAKNDLDEDTKFFRDKATKHADKISNSKKEEKAIQEEEEDINLIADKESSKYKQGKLRIERRKEALAKTKQSLEDEGKEIDTLFENLKAQKTNYKQSETEVLGERAKYLQENAQQKAEALSGLDSKTAFDIIDKDSFSELKKDGEKEIQALEQELSTVSKDSARYQMIATQIAAKKEEQTKVVNDLRKAIKNEYLKQNYVSSAAQNTPIPATATTPLNPPSTYTTRTPIDFELPDDPTPTNLPSSPRTPAPPAPAAATIPITSTPSTSSTTQSQSSIVIPESYRARKSQASFDMKTQGSAPQYSLKSDERVMTEAELAEMKRTFTEHQSSQTSTSSSVYVPTILTPENIRTTNYTDRIRRIDTPETV